MVIVSPWNSFGKLNNFKLMWLLEAAVKGLQDWMNNARWTEGM